MQLQLESKRSRSICTKQGNKQIHINNELEEIFREQTSFRTTDALIRHVWTPVSLRGNVDKSTFLLSAPDTLAELTDAVVPHGINNSFGGSLMEYLQDRNQSFEKHWVPLMQKDAEAFAQIGNRWPITSCLSG